MHIKSTLPILFLLFIFSCSSTNELTISVVEPAIIHIPSNVKRVGIINRSIPKNSGDRVVDILDKVLSAEGLELDKEGAEKTIESFSVELNSRNKFSEVVIIKDSDIETTGLRVFPSSLSWEVVQKICSEYNLDGLYELSFYDTDATVNIEAQKAEREVPILGDIPLINQKITIITDIKCGWRYYNPKDAIIQDEFVMNERVVSSSQSVNPAKTAEAIVGRKQQVLDMSRIIGENYAYRSLPVRLRVRRLYYVDGTENFEKGQRLARTGQWQEAAKLWEKEVKNPDPEIAGRACYNMGIINEINGDLKGAHEWASKSYVEYENDLALDYVKILENRMRKQRILDSQ